VSDVFTPQLALIQQEHQQVTVAEAEQELEAFAQQWDRFHPSINRSWRSHWINLGCVLNYFKK
jgi:putative transposase